MASPGQNAAVDKVTVWEGTVVVFDGVVVEVFRQSTEGHRLLLEHVADATFQAGSGGGGYLKLGRVMLQVEPGREGDAEALAQKIRMAGGGLR